MDSRKTMKWGCIQKGWKPVWNSGIPDFLAFPQKLLDLQEKDQAGVKSAS